MDVESNSTKELQELAMRLFEQIPDDFTSERRRQVLLAMSDLCDLWEKWDAEAQDAIKRGISSS